MIPLTPEDSFGQDVISQWPHLGERFLFRNANCNSLVKRDGTLGREAIESANLAAFITNHSPGYGAFLGGVEGSMGADSEVITGLEWKGSPRLEGVGSPPSENSWDSMVKGRDSEDRPGLIYCSKLSSFSSCDSSM